MTNRFPQLQLPNEALGRRAATSAHHHEETADMSTNIGNPIGMTGPNVAPATKVVAPGASLASPSASDQTSGPAPGTNAAAAGPSVAPACTRSKIQAIGRIRASPARLFKLNKILSPDQKALVIEWVWGGMLMVKASEMPVDLSMWVLSCYDPIRSELAIPGRGTIPVDAESFNKVFGLPNEGLPVVYEMETEPIYFMNEMYNIQGGSAPEFKQW